MTRAVNIIASPRRQQGLPLLALRAGNNDYDEVFICFSNSFSRFTVSA